MALPELLATLCALQANSMGPKPPATLYDFAPWLKTDEMKLEEWKDRISQKALALHSMRQEQRARQDN